MDLGVDRPAGISSSVEYQNVSILPSPPSLFNNLLRLKVCHARRPYPRDVEYPTSAVFAGVLVPARHPKSSKDVEIAKVERHLRSSRCAPYLEMNAYLMAENTTFVPDVAL